MKKLVRVGRTVDNSTTYEVKQGGLSVVIDKYDSGAIVLLVSFEGETEIYQIQHDNR